jgi:hypothetical protein
LGFEALSGVGLRQINLVSPVFKNAWRRTLRQGFVVGAAVPAIEIHNVSLLCAVRFSALSHLGVEDVVDFQ